VLAPGQESVSGPARPLVPVAEAAVLPEAAPSGPKLSLKAHLREQELAYINRALAQSGGDKERAAELLGVSLATLYRKLSEDEG